MKNELIITIVEAIIIYDIIKLFIKIFISSIFKVFIKHTKTGKNIIEWYEKNKSK